MSSSYHHLPSPAKYFHSVWGQAGTVRVPLYEYKSQTVVRPSYLYECSYPVLVATYCYAPGPSVRLPSVHNPNSRINKSTA